MKRYLTAALVAFALVGCGTAGGPDGDASPVRIDRTRPDLVVAFPEGFSNVATKCVWDGWRAFVSGKYSGKSPLQVVPDPTCKVKR